VAPSGAIRTARLNWDVERLISGNATSNSSFILPKNSKLPGQNTPAKCGLI